MRAAIGESRAQRPRADTVLMFALQVITAIRTKPDKLLLIPFLFVLKVLFQALSVPPPPAPFPLCARLKRSAAAGIAGHAARCLIPPAVNSRGTIHRGTGATRGMSSGVCSRQKIPESCPCQGRRGRRRLLSPSAFLQGCGCGSPRSPQRRPCTPGQPRSRPRCPRGPGGGPGCSGSPLALRNCLLRGQSIVTDFHGWLMEGDVSRLSYALRGSAITKVLSAPCPIKPPLQPSVLQGHQSLSKASGEHPQCQCPAVVIL